MPYLKSWLAPLADVSRTYAIHPPDTAFEPASIPSPFFIPIF